VPARLRPSAPIAPDAVLVGDPGRALLLAQELLSRPKMANHARGLWGYSGETWEGRPLTVQSTGIGAPSAALVLRDLAELGVSRAVRVGTCAGRAALGDLLVVRSALATDTIRDLLSAGEKVEPDPALLAALGQVGSPVEIESGGLGPGEDAPAAHDLQTAALLALAPRLGVAAAAVLILAESASGERLTAEQLEAAAKRAGRAAAAALASPPSG
jgi:uridine phosphorylase